MLNTEMPQLLLLDVWGPPPLMSQEISCDPGIWCDLVGIRAWQCSTLWLFEYFQFDNSIMNFSLKFSDFAVAIT